MFLLCLNLWLMVIDCLSVFLFSFGCLPVFLFGFDYLCFCRGKAFPLSTSFPFMYSFISPFLIFRILLFSALFFLISLHQVSAGPPIRKGTLPVLYHIYEKIWRSWERQRWICQVPSFLSPTLPDGGRKGWYLRLFALPFFVKLKWNGIFPWHNVCVRWVNCG